jgi:hypothetical protein
MVHHHKFGTENVFIFQNKTIITIIERMTPLILHYAPSIYTTLCFYIEFIIILKQLLDNKKKSLNKTEEVHYNLNIYTFFFLDSRKPHLPKSAFCETKWVSKTLAVPGSYKRYTPWLELEIYSANLKSFIITPRSLGTLNIYTSTHNLLNLDVTFFRFSTRDTPSTLI